MPTKRHISVRSPLVQTLEGSEKDVVGFIFVFKSRNVKRKKHSSYFLLKSQLLRTNALDCTTVPCSYTLLPTAVAAMLRRDVWMTYSCIFCRLRASVPRDASATCLAPGWFRGLDGLSSLGKVL